MAGRCRLLFAVVFLLPAIPGLRGFAIPPTNVQPTSSMSAHTARFRAMEPHIWRSFPVERSFRVLGLRRVPKAAMLGVRGQERPSASPSDDGKAPTNGPAHCETHSMSQRRTVLARAVAGAVVLLFGPNAREVPAETGVATKRRALVKQAHPEAKP